MNTHRVKDIIIFVAVFIGISVAVGFGIKFFKNNPSDDPFERLAMASSTNAVMPSPIMTTASTTTTTTSSTANVSNSSTQVSSNASATAVMPAEDLPTTSTVSIASTTPSAPPPAPVETAESSATPKISLPYSIGTFDDGFVTGDGWNNWWGYSAENNGVLTIGATSSTTGGGALLEGSAGWTDYTFQATVDWDQGETIGIIARYVDSNDYLVCEFDEKNVGDVNIRLDEHLGGNVTHLAEGDVLDYEEMGGVNLTIAIQVQGNQGTCEFNGHTVSTLFASDSIDPKLSSGEIGFTTWDAATDNSQMDVRNIGVSPTFYPLGKNVEPAS